MGRDTGAARQRPLTHGDAKEAVTITPEEHAAQRPSTAATAGPKPAEPYRKGDFMGKPFHQCPHCDMNGISHDFIERHVKAVHVRRPPTDAQRAAAAGLIVPGNE